MPDLSTLPSRFTPFTGNPSAVTPTMADQLFYKSDETGGASGIYKGTGLSAGDLDLVADIGGGSGGGLTVVADITALKALTPAADTAAYVVSKAAIYGYDLDGTGTGNDEWLVTPTSGTGRWYPVTFIDGTTTPSGASAYPIMYRLVSTGSGSNTITTIYHNPGGGSTVWTTK